MREASYPWVEKSISGSIFVDKKGEKDGIPDPRKYLPVTQTGYETHFEDFVSAENTPFWMKIFPLRRMKNYEMRFKMRTFPNSEAGRNCGNPNATLETELNYHLLTAEISRNQRQR